MNTIDTPVEATICVQYVSGSVQLKAILIYIYIEFLNIRIFPSLYASWFVIFLLELLKLLTVSSLEKWETTSCILNGTRCTRRHQVPLSAGALSYLGPFAGTGEERHTADGVKTTRRCLRAQGFHPQNWGGMGGVMHKHVCFFKRNDMI